jgi:hypothetical protein
MKILLVAAAAVLAYRGCLGVPPSPTAICGKEIGGAMIPVVIDATSGDRTENMAGNPGDEFWVRLTDSCSEGVAVHVQPPDAATFGKQVTAKGGWPVEVLATDGKPVAIYIRANQRDFALLLHRHDGTRNTVRFRIHA